MRKMISILVRNRPGVLSHVASLVTRRGYNVESIAAGPTENEDVTRITLIVSGDEQVLEQVTKQIRKLVDVIRAQDLNYSESITREAALVTVAVLPERRGEIINMVNTFGIKIADLTEKTVTLEIVGSERLVDMVLTSLKPFRIKGMARTGLVALPLENREDRKSTIL